MGYSISIITPFHNIKMDVFDQTIASLKQQTFGFENIEWVIVVHNSEDSYYNDVVTRLRDCPNVIIDRISNDIHTPSSPRNRGLEIATGRCVGFLDGDDKFREDAIEKIVAAFDRTKAQVLVFRREYELEFSDMLALSETTAVNQTYKEIIVTKDGGVDNRVYNDFPFFVTNRAYDLQFLREKNITFDESFEIAEDCYFNLLTIGEADKICILPQLIGYNYYINSGSMLSSPKTDEQILHMLDNVIGNIERAMNYGLYANHIIICLGFVMSRYLAFPDVKMETRIKVKNAMEPYLRMTTPIPRGRFCEPFNSLMNTLPFEILLNVERFDSNIKSNGLDSGFSILYDIIKSNINTDFGQRYHFADILSEKGYQYQVPISKPKDYQPLLDLQMSIGETAILSEAKTSWYVEMINGMKLPVNKQLAKDFANHFENVLSGQKVFLWWEGDTSIKEYNDGIPVSSIYIISLTEYLRQLLYGKQAKCAFTSPLEITMNRDEKDYSYLYALLAVAQKDVDQIVIYNSWDYEALVDVISDYWETIIKDIENGTISHVQELGNETKKILKAYIYPDKERADQLRNIKKNEEGLIDLKKVWPSLSKISTTSAQTKGVRDFAKGYAFDGICYENTALITEMGVIGKNAGEGTFELCTDSIYYEFMEEGSAKNTLPKTIDAVEKGKVYSLAVTTRSGIYRCMLPFKISITDIKDGKVFFV